MPSPSVFELLRRTTAGNALPGPATPVRFQLAHDDGGAFLDVIGPDGQPLRDVDYRRYQGATRDVLRVVTALWEETRFRISWDARSADRLYLADHPVLLWPLRQSDALVDAAQHPLRFADGTAELLVAIAPDDPEADLADPATALRSRLLLLHEGRRLTQPQFVTERFWLADHVLYETPPLGEHAAALAHFDTSLQAGDLDAFLSLLHSHVPEVTAQVAGCKVTSGAPRQAQPTLFFEKVDAGQALYLRVTVSVPGVPPTLFADYELTTLVHVDALARTVTVSPMAYDLSGTPGQDLRRRLRATQRQFDDRDAATFVEDGGLFILSPDLARAFLREHLTALTETYLLYGAEKLREYQIRTVTPTLDLRLDHGLDFLEGDASLTIDGQRFGLFDALHRFRRDGYVVLNDGTQAIVNQGYLERLNRLFQKKQDKVRLSFFDLPLVEELIDERVAEASLPQAREVFRGFNRLPEQEAALPRLQATLRPYQVYGFKWMDYLRTHALGGCLADEMGLGKTIQTIALLSAVYSEAPPEAPSLIVMPRSLLFNWAHEIDRFASHLAHHTYYGTDRDLDTARRAQLILTTYDIVRNDIETLKDVPFHYVVLDEAQRIKNIASQTSRAVMLLEARHRLALSGTPIQNNLGELYALFRFLNPAMFGSAQAFARDYAQPIQRDQNPDVAHELRKKIYPFVLRRLKRDVARDLPERIDQVLYVEMSPPQQQLYEARRVFYREAVHQRIAADGVQRSQFFILQALNELRQIATVPETFTEGRLRSAKREVLLEQLLDLTANDRKALIFTNYLQAIESLGDDLAAAGLDYVTMTGATRHRQQLVERFQHDPAVNAFLMTLKTGSLGLNLTAADTVFLYDPWWNQAAEDQAVDRTHRIGQTATVFSYKLITRGTIEEKILQLQEHKRTLFDQIIAADQGALKHLDEDDIDFIFG